ncbi:hypothetical protein V5O48_011795 [Marasmius crinis-equi]|uniref:Uncharacterized protein n=1 Tax=Marasmius crinis-equi TaxID=585013 RepID=A0ABR3F4L5_9AGAR
MTTCSANRALVIHALVLTEAFALQLAEHRTRWKDIHFVIDEYLDCSQIFGNTKLPVLEKATIVACPLEYYPNYLHEAVLLDLSDSVLDISERTFDLSQCPSLTHVAFGATIPSLPPIRVILPAAQLTRLELNTLAPISLTQPKPTEVEELVFPNLLWLHIVDEAGVGPPGGLRTPKLRHPVLSDFSDAEGILDLLKRSFSFPLCSLELRAASPAEKLNHRSVSELLQYAGLGLGLLCFSVVGIDSLLELKWSDLRGHLQMVRYIEIRVKAKVALDRLLPDSHLPPTFDYLAWSDRGEHLTRSAWWRFVDQNADFISMVTALPELRALELDWDRSVYRDRWYSPAFQQTVLRRGICSLRRDDAEHSGAIDNRLSLLQTQILKRHLN